MSEQTHVPVMLEEALEGLDLKPAGRYWDGTFGRGGHSRAILERLGANGQLIASDRDAAAAEEAGRIKDTRLRFIHSAFEEVVDEVGELDGFLWDLGCSTPQLKDPTRGFSFSETGPLDMRMDQEQETSAETIVNEYGEKDLANLIYQYGEERLSRRIAARIVSRREHEPITDTLTLAEICKAAYPRKYHRIHPATRTFQALRIATNDELGQLERALPRAIERLAPGGRAVVISFHSLEDRLVKHLFRDLAKQGGYHMITKKPLVPSDGEVENNPASRSAKLRILEREA